MLLHPLSQKKKPMHKSTITLHTIKFLALLICAMGCFVLLGWYTKKEWIVQIHSSFVPMQFNTALCFLLAGSSVALLLRKKYGYACVCGIGILILSSLTMLQYRFGLDFGIDQLFMAHYISVKTPYPGRMGFSTAFCFTLSAIVITFLSIQRDRTNLGSHIVTVLAAIVIGLGSVSCVGYILGLETAKGWGNMSQMAVHTSVAFVCLGCSLVLYTKLLAKNSKINKFWVLSWSTPLIVSVIFFLYVAVSVENTQRLEQKVTLQGEILVGSIDKELLNIRDALVRLSNRLEPELTAQEIKVYLDDFDAIYAMGLFDSNGFNKQLFSNPLFPKKIKDDYLLSQNICDRNNIKTCYSVRSIKSKYYLVISTHLKRSNAVAGYLESWISLDELISGLQLTFSGVDFLIALAYSDKYLLPEQIKDTFKSNNTIYYSQQLSLNKALNLKINVIYNGESNLSFKTPIQILNLGLVLVVFVSLMFSINQTISVREQRDKASLLLAKNQNYLQVMLDGLLVTNRQGIIQEVNTALCQIFGYQSAEDLIDKPVDCLFSEQSQNSNINWLRTYFVNAPTNEKQMGRSFALLGLHKSGIKIPLQITLYSDTKSDNDLVYAAVTDTTEHDLITEELDKNKRFIARALDASFAGIYVFNLRENKNEYINESYSKITGYSATQLNTLSVEEFLILFHPDDLPRLLEHQAIIARDSEHDNQVHELEYRFKHAKGHWITLLSKDTGFEFDSQGEMTHFIGCFIDVTDRKEYELRLLKSQKELKISEERYDLAIEGAGVGIWDWDLTTDKLFWSDRFLAQLGYQSNDIEVTLDIYKSMIHPDDFEKVWEALNKHFTDRVPYEQEHRLRCKNGLYRWFKGVGKARFDDNGKPLRMLGSVDDINNQKLLEISLKNSNAELEQFAYIASHDLKEPVRTLSTFSKYLLSDVQNQNTERVEQDIEYIQSASIRLTKLIDDLLELSRVGSNTIKKVNIPVKPLLDDVITRLQTQIDENQVVFNFELSQDSICVDPMSFGQVLQNIIQNAIKFRKEQETPYITISSQLISGGDQVSIIVEDNGIGIEESMIGDIFGIFKKLHSHTTFSGNGIGLAIVSKTIQKHGGEITASSKIGVGTSFTIILPTE